MIGRTWLLSRRWCRMCALGQELQYRTRVQYNLRSWPATRSQRKALEDGQCEKCNKGRGKGSPEDNKDSHGKCGPVRIYADSLLDTRVFEIQKTFTFWLASSFKGDTTGISGIPVDIGRCIASGLLGFLGTFGYVPTDEQIFVGIQYSTRMTAIHPVSRAFISFCVRKDVRSRTLADLTGLTLSIFRESNP